VSCHWVVAAINDRGQLYDRRAKEVVPAIIGDEAVHKALLLKQLIRVIQVVNDALETTAQNALGRRLTLTELPKALPSRRPCAKQFPICNTSRNSPPVGRCRSSATSVGQPGQSALQQYLAGPVLVLPNSPEEDIVDSLLLQAEQRFLDRRYFARESTALGGTAEQFWWQRNAGPVLPASFV